MPNTISPFFRSPFSDITGGMISHQFLGRCQKQEEELFNCMEAYGLDLGKRKCVHLIDDFTECHKDTLKFKRFVTMRNERDRQIAEGKLTKDRRYVSPKVDAY